jgi:hypothetical protein
VTTTPEDWVSSAAEMEATEAAEAPPVGESEAEYLVVERPLTATLGELLAAKSEAEG